jgi:hypothetical protein
MQTPGQLGKDENCFLDKKQVTELLASLRNSYFGNLADNKSLRELEAWCEDFLNSHAKEEKRKEEVRKGIEEVKKEVEKMKEKAKEYENMGGESSGTKKEEKIVIQHGPEIGLDCCMPELLTRMKACSGMNVAAIHVNCGIPTPIDSWGSPVFGILMGTFLDYVKQHPRFFLCPVENEPLFRYGHIMMTKSFVDSIPDTLVTQKTLAIRKIGVEEKKKKEEKEEKEEKEKEKEKEEKEEKEKEKEKEKQDQNIIREIGRSPDSTFKCFEKLIKEGETMTPLLCAQILAQFCKQFPMIQVKLSLSSLIKLYDIEPRFIDKFFKEGGFVTDPLSSQKDLERNLLVLFTGGDSSHCDRAPLVRQYLKRVGKFTFNGRLPTILIALTIRIPGKTAEHYAHYMHLVGHTIIYEELVELLDCYCLKTEQLLPFMKLIDLEASGVFSLMYRHVQDPVAFLKPILDVVQYGLFKVKRSEILKALIISIENADRAPMKTALFNLLKKFSKPFEELMDDSSMVCYLASLDDQVMKELKEYRQHYQ